MCVGGGGRGEVTVYTLLHKDKDLSTQVGMRG